MNAQPDLDALERALSMSAARAASLRPGQPRPLSWSSRLRRFWDRHRSWIKILIYGSGVVFLLTQGQIRNLFGFLLFLLPLWIRDYHEQRKQIEALQSDEDFLKAERERVEQRLRREVFTLLLMLFFAALMGVAAIFGKHPQAAGLVSGFVLACVLLRWALFLPGLRRELEDLGGDARKHWILNAILVCLVIPYLLVLPLIWLCHRLHDLWLWITNRRSDS
jgi:cell division protein FtsB